MTTELISQVLPLRGIAAGDLVETESAAGVSGHSALGTLAAKSAVNDADWSGAALSVANGGTGATTGAAACAALGAVKIAGDTMIGTLALPAGSAGAPGLNFGAATAGFYAPAAGQVGITANGVLQMQVTQSNILTRATTAFAFDAVTPRVQLNETSAVTTGAANIQWSNNSTGPRQYFGKSRGTAAGTHTIVVSGYELGGSYFAGSDGAAFVTAASITVEVDGTPGVGDMPGRIVFSTTADGAAAPTERLRIDNAGNLQMAGANTVITAARLLVLRSYTVATVPAATPAGAEIYVADESGGAVPAFADGTNWRRCTDRAVIS
ncbi:hypothetical protein [Zavarzinia sp.]|uniref:hypothetical protein n=1 Tax=Zavarzinia sp. TaxID=2027920 RepID=UPI003BB7BE84